MDERQASLRDWSARGRLPGSVPFVVGEGYVSHPLLAPRTVEHREFQVAIARRALERSTLVVLPTGLGKTVIAVLVAADVLRRGERVLLLAPTRPLAVQHQQSFERLLPGLKSALFTGSDGDRPALWKEAQAVFATPQGLGNDLEGDLYGLGDVGLLIFDEAHRAVGDYSYVAIAERYRRQRSQPLVLGLTASPGSKQQRVDEVVAHLGIANVESRSPEDLDVRDHVAEIDVEWVKVKLPKELKQAQKLLTAVLRERVKKLQRSGFIVHKPTEVVSKTDVLQAGDLIRKRLARRRMGYLFGAMSNAGVALQAYHTVELVETQGAAPFLAYLEKLALKEQPGKSDRVFLADPRVQGAREAVEGLEASHPKLKKLVEVLRGQRQEHREGLVLVFAQYRDTIDSILRALAAAGLEAERFVGQASRGADKGMSQAVQQEVLERFRRGEVRILVASSVAEEGLDIPQVDLVVFYEPVVSEIRAIQRRGRTGRGRAGRVVVLVAEKTRDEAYAHAELRRERKMESLVRAMGEPLAEAAEDALDPEEPA
ncbi:MAG TPA: helicase-related protein [Candidatus Thermoplasmatota archaeon]|nr:helicase-related protein [Candidatus Thermoplasmatota archaeon]